MVQVLRILALVALVAVSATAETVERRQTDSTVVISSHAARMLVAEAGSGSGTGGGATVGIPAANQPVLAQWTAAKALLEKAFANEPTLLASLKEFETTVATALKTEITLDQAKAIIAKWLASLEKDPAYAKVSAQLAPIKAVLGDTGSTKAGSGSGATGSNTVGSTKAPTTNSSSNSTAATPAPSSAASTVAAFVVPTVVAIAGVVASL